LRKIFNINSNGRVTINLGGWNIKSIGYTNEGQAYYCMGEPKIIIVEKDSILKEYIGTKSRNNVSTISHNTPSIEVTTIPQEYIPADIYWGIDTITVKVGRKKGATTIVRNKE
jgi:hypothetical protein